MITRRSLTACTVADDDIMCVTAVLIGGKFGLVCSYGNVDKSCAFVLCDSGVRVFLVDCDLICVLQACFEIIQVAAIKSIVSRSTWLAWRAWKNESRQHHGPSGSFRLPRRYARFKADFRNLGCATGLLGISQLASKIILIRPENATFLCESTFPRCYGGFLCFF